jgi:hypothetical protein
MYKTTHSSTPGRKGKLVDITNSSNAFFCPKKKKNPILKQLISKNNEHLHSHKGKLNMNDPTRI